MLSTVIKTRRGKIYDEAGYFLQKFFINFYGIQAKITLKLDKKQENFEICF